jgi:hypothetical protein
MYGGNEQTLVHVIIIVLLLFIIWKLHSTNEKLKEKAYVGYGLDKYLYTSGATMRRLGQVFSQPGQGVQTTVYNAELKTDPNQLSAQGIPVVMYLNSGNSGNLYTAINAQTPTPNTQ